MAQAAPILSRSEDFPFPFGRFTLLAPLGEGGMGRVYRAWMNGPDGFRKPVALKILTPKRPDPEHRAAYDASIRNEARIGALLRHPGLVEVYDYGVEDGVPWIAMELVEGVDLEGMFRGASPLPPGAVLDLGMQLSAALAYAHDVRDEGRAVSMVHRDLKPANLLIDRFGQLKITDFGIARSALSTGVTTVQGVMKGTPTFMAPEQILGLPVDARADLFSVGAILFEAAVGRRLLRREGAAATVAAVLAVDEVMSPEVVAEVDAAVPGLGEVVARCLRKDLSTRMPSADALGEALLEVSLGLPPRLMSAGSLGAVLALLQPDALGSRRPPTPSPFAVSALHRLLGALPEEPRDGATSTSMLFAQLGLTPEDEDEGEDEGEPRSLPRVPDGEPLGQPSLAARLPPAPRARGPEAWLVLALALLTGFSGNPGQGTAAAGFSLPPVAEASPSPDPIAAEPATLQLADVLPPSPELPPRVRRRPVVPPPEVSLVPTERPASAAPQARHTRLVSRARPGTTRSFIVETPGESPGQVRLFLRSGQGPWRHLNLERVAEGYWGVVVPFDEAMVGTASYWFEVQPPSGPAYALGGAEQPFLIQVLP